MDVFKPENLSGPNVLKPLTVAPAPSAAPTGAAPPTPANDTTGSPSDRNLVESQRFGEIGDLGALPWDDLPAQPPVADEARKEAIRAIYREAMGREVSDHGLNFWANRTASLDEIRSTVEKSPEATFYRGLKGEARFDGLDRYHAADPESKLQIEQLLNLVNHPTRESHLAAAQDVFTSSLEFKALSPEQQTVLKGFFDGAAVGASTEQINEAALGILSGLKKERFTAKDAFGQSTLDHLEQFNRNGLVIRGEDKAAMGRDLLNALVHPETLTQGEDTLDCAEATLEATLAYSQPADYARIAVGLLTRGSASIPGPPGSSDRYGEDGQFGPGVLQLATAGNSAGRDRLSFFMQRSFEAHVASRQDAENFWLAGQDTGLNAHQVKMLYDGIIGKEHMTIYANQGVDVTAAVEKALKDQNTPSATVKVTMREGGMLHAKAVIGSSPEGLTLWDPATGKTENLSREEFNRQVARATLVGSAARTGQWNWNREYVENDSSQVVGGESEGGGRLGSARRWG